MTSIHDAAAAYDAALLTKARQLASLNTTEDRQAWLRQHSEPGTMGAQIADGTDWGLIRAYVDGITKAVLGELVRWLDRIPEEHRG